MAFDKKTGRKVWVSGAGVPGYATPVVYGKGKCVAIFAKDAIYGVHLKSGRRLWSYPWITRHFVNAADPLVQGNHVFISSGYEKGCVLLDVSRGRARVVWRNVASRSHFGSNLILDDHIYAADGNTGGRGSGVKCISIKTGEEAWAGPTGFCSLMAADGKLLILTERGDLVVARASPKAWEEIARARVISLKRGAKCWTAPVLCRGLVYCRSTTGTMVCVDMRP
jgi:outer membrane protein assembly factor BamB